MKVNIIGGGPAGLYFAILLKKQDPSHDITIYERVPVGVTWGWGVVFSGQTLSFLRNADPESYETFKDRLELWDNVDVRIGETNISIHGNRFSGAGRMTLIGVLEARAEELGLTVQHEIEIKDPKKYQDCDLLIGADGVTSVVREAWANTFQPSLDWRNSRFIWLGTERLFHGLTLTFRETEWGGFAAHSYKFSPNQSTFIAECTEDTFKKAGFDTLPVEDSIKGLESIFAQDLDGNPLLSNQSTWRQFPVVRNKKWHHENIVLLGDSLHTAHFSIGSGTKLAMEDSIALAGIFETTRDVPEALAEFERTRKPIVDSLQDAAEDSMVWFETFDDKMELDPYPFAYSLMTRSGRIDHENLRTRDPEFIAAYENAIAS